MADALEALRFGAALPTEYGMDAPDAETVRRMMRGQRLCLWSSVFLAVAFVLLLCSGCSHRPNVACTHRALLELDDLERRLLHDADVACVHRSPADCSRYQREAAVAVDVVNAIKSQIEDLQPTVSRLQRSARP